MRPQGYKDFSLLTTTFVQIYTCWINLERQEETTDGYKFRIALSVKGPCNI